MTNGGTPAILAARLARVDASDESIGDDALEALHRGLVRPAIAGRGGELAGTAGDSIVAEFPDAVAAVGSALDLQRAGAASDLEISFGIGIDLPDDPGRIDTAVRLEELAGDGEVYVSAPVRDASVATLDVPFEGLGSHPLVDRRPVEVYRVAGKRRTARASAAAAVSLASLGLVRLTGRRRVAESETDEEGTSCQFCSVLHIDVPAAPDTGAVAAVAADVDEEPEFTIVGGDDEQRALAEYARDRFEEYGLALPDVVIRFHTVEDKDEQCGGHVAVARHGEDEAQIDMCGTTASTLVHELTHVWAKEGLGDDVRADFLEMRGLESWAGGDVRWGLRGSEHAANVIAWGMQPENPVRPTGTLPNDEKSLAEAFRLLTGGQEPMSLRVALESGEIELFAEAPSDEGLDQDEGTAVVSLGAEDGGIDAFDDAVSGAAWDEGGDGDGDGEGPLEDPVVEGHPFAAPGTGPLEDDAPQDELLVE